jgi:hypothetical protein
MARNTGGTIKHESGTAQKNAGARAVCPPNKEANAATADNGNNDNKEGNDDKNKSQTLKISA